MKRTNPPRLSSSALWSAIDHLTAIAKDVDCTSLRSNSLQGCSIAARDAVLAYNDLLPDCSVSTTLTTLNRLVEATHRVASLLRPYAHKKAGFETLVHDVTIRTDAINRALKEVNPASLASTSSRVQWINEAFSLVANLDRLRPQLLDLRGTASIEADCVLRDDKVSGKAEISQQEASLTSTSTAALVETGVAVESRGEVDRAEISPTSVTIIPHPDDEEAPTPIIADFSEQDSVKTISTATDSHILRIPGEENVSQLQILQDQQSREQIFSDEIASTKGDATRVLFDAPQGIGLAREFDGDLFTFDPRIDVWITEDHEERRRRGQNLVNRLVRPVKEACSQPWQDYLPVTASLAISRELATAVMGSYESATGCELKTSTLRISAAEPLPQLNLALMLERAMSPLWRSSRWRAKVSGSPDHSREHADLWSEIAETDREYRVDRAAWIEVWNVDTVEGCPGEDSGDPLLQVMIDPESNNPVSRFKEAADAFSAKPAPKEDRERGVYTRSLLPADMSASRCALLLGPAGTGKSHNATCYRRWASLEYGYKLRIFDYSAASHRYTANQYTALIDEIEMWEARGTPCLLMCDEVQHLTAPDVERLAVCTLLCLSGDVRQAAADTFVHPVIAFARRIGASVLTMRSAWRASNSAVFNAMSYVFYDGSFFALGRADEKAEAPLFRYDVCADDAEVIAARCWAAARNFRDRDPRSFMLAIERDDVHQAVLQIAGSDARPWTKGPTRVKMTKPSQYQGREADVVLVIADEILSASDDVSVVLRGLNTLLGRAREEIWVLFTKKLELDKTARRAAASVLRSLFENVVSNKVTARALKLESKVQDEVSHYDLTVHEFEARTNLLAYKDQYVGFVTTAYRGEGGEVPLKELIRSKGWLLIDIQPLGGKIYYYCDNRMLEDRAAFKEKLLYRTTQIDRRLAAQL